MTIWTLALEAAIAKSLEDSGCSFRDAAESNGIPYETLKARQRVDQEFSALLRTARTKRKVKSLGRMHELADEGNVAALSWTLNQLYRAEDIERSKFDETDAEAATAAPSVTYNTIVLGDPSVRLAHDAYLAALAGAIGQGERPEQSAGVPVRSHEKHANGAASLPPPATDKSAPR